MSCDVFFSPSPVHSEAERGDGGAVGLTFDLPQSPPPGSNPLLLLAFETPLAEGILNITFSSQLLQPETQVMKGQV